MSDLRSEMVNKVLNQWENVSMHTSNKPVAVANKQSFGERIFEYVKAHPYSSVDEVERGLGVDKKASVSSYLKTQLDKGLLAREEKLRLPYPGLGSRYYFVYYHISDSYTLPHKPRKPRKPRIDRKPQFKDAFLTGDDIAREINAPLAEKLARPRMAQAFSPEMFVQDLSLKDARAVYELLKGYFSG